MDTETDQVVDTITSEVDAKSVIIVAVALAAVTAVAVWRFRSKMKGGNILPAVDPTTTVD